MAEVRAEIEQGKTPWGVWWSMVAGFAAWGSDLALSYMLEQHSCSTGHHYVLHTISLVCFLVALSGFATGLSGLRMLPSHASDEGGSRFDRTHFQALIGMMFSLSFAVVIIAGAVPRWILSPCD